MAAAAFCSTPSRRSRAIAPIAAAHRREGVTGFLPTVVTDAPEVLAQALTAARKAHARVPGALGVHVEGPFIDPRRKGVHPAEWIRPMQEKDARRADRHAGRRHGRHPRAGERAARPRRPSCATGIVVSLGHSDATAEEAEAVFDAGARAVTHLFNAMSQLSSRAPGVVGAALADPRIVCGLIADGEHARPAAYRTAIAAKGPARGRARFRRHAARRRRPGRIRPAGTADEAGRRKLVDENGTLAGAAISMSDAVRYCVRDLGRPAAEALTMATLTPARLLGLDSRIGRLAPGCAADLVHLTDTLEVAGVWAGGRRAEEIGAPG